MTSGMLWGPGKLGRDGELYVSMELGCDNSSLLSKIECDGIGQSLLLEIKDIQV